MSGVVCRLIALHGFLGSNRDWDSIREALPWAEIDAIDLWPLTAAAGADAWGSIGEVLEKELAERARREPLMPAVVLGYSFGARLALAVKSLADGTLPVAGVCLVSCNPGLAEDDHAARATRQKSDEGWARMLMGSAEAEIRAAWASQPVLSGSASTGADPAASEAPLPAPRYALAVAMRRFSLAGQPDFRPRIGGWRTPLLWVTGEEDARFTAIAQALAAGGARAEFAVCKNAGHRVPWDNPEAFGALLRGWLRGRAGIGRGGTL